MIIDAHAHVSTEKFAQDREAVLARAWAAGVEAIVDVGCSLASSQDSLRLAEREPRVWAAVGVHPHDAKEWDAGTRAALEALAKSPRVVAIGETGLDFHYDFSPRDAQRRVFREHLRLARDLDRPLVLHVREAYDEALETLDEVLGPWPGDGRPAGARGVSHCFTGDARQALGFVARGFHVSFTGVVTFKSAETIREAARAIPLASLMVETDCPYMAPVPNRGKRCEPAFVVDTARFIATLRGEDEARVFRATVDNTRAVFRLPV